jgi:hypothetical protein
MGNGTGRTWLSKVYIIIFSALGYLKKYVESKY